MVGIALLGIDLYITTTTVPSIIRDIGGSSYARNTVLYERASILGTTAVAAHVLVAHDPDACM